MRNKYMDKLIFAMFLTLVVMVGNLIYDNIATKCNAELKENIKTIILDMGHGDFDGGAVANDGTLEKDINLEIGLKLKRLMEDSGYNVICTREKDRIYLEGNPQSIREKKLADMERRLNIIRENPNGIFVSIHQNKFPDESVRGAQVFYNEKSPNSAVLARLIQESIKNNADEENKRMEKASGKEYYLLENIENCGVIVECGFISNQQELLKLKNEEYQNILAESILKGIENYLKKDINEE